MVILKLKRHDNTSDGWTILRVHKAAEVLCFCNLLSNESGNHAFGVHTSSTSSSTKKLGFVNGKGILK